MRKIEQGMIAAIRNGLNFTQANTAVRQFGTHCAVYLHGSMIAQIGHPQHGTRWTLAGWNTPTTRSRVNALARAFNWRGVCTVRGVPHAFASTGDPASLTVRSEIAADSWVNALT